MVTLRSTIVAKNKGKDVNVKILIHSGQNEKSPSLPHESINFCINLNIKMKGIFTENETEQKQKSQKQGRKYNKIISGRGLFTISIGVHLLYWVHLAKTNAV